MASLLLGLYDGAGLLHHVGFCSSMKASEREKLTVQQEGRSALTLLHAG